MGLGPMLPGSGPGTLPPASPPPGQSASGRSLSWELEDYVRKMIVDYGIALGPQGPSGEQGEPGEPGSGGDKTFRHQQMVPSTHWDISHMLGKKPSFVALTSDDGDIVEPDQIVYVDDDHTTLIFVAPFSGLAYGN